MAKNDKLFRNLFTNPNITPERLYAFGEFVLNSLIAANNPAKYGALITLLTQALADLATEISDVDGNLNQQVSNTKSVHAVMDAFRQYMSDEEPFIARALGGVQTEAYHSFYPHKVSEYTNATKTNIKNLSTRVHELAIKYATELGTSMATALQGFAPAYTTALNKQQQKIGTVQKDRSARDSAVLQVQLALTTAVHTVAAANPGDVKTCAAFFPFSMLLSQAKHKRYKLSGKLAADETSELLNRTLGKKVIITIRNTGDNAAIAVWLSATATAPMPETALEVQPGSTATIKAEVLGNLKYTFLMIKNISAVNSCAYEVELAGLKKAVENATATTEAMAIVRA